jgi:thiol-disulfide isomerase/thioredoxin
VLVYADWCGHCKDFKPIFENAEKSPNRTAQTVKVNDVMFPQVTDIIKNKMNMNAKPMSVEGYPSVILVDKKGNMIQNVAAVKDQGTMNSLMEKAGTLARESEDPIANVSMNNTRSKSKSGANASMIEGKPLPSLRVSKNSIAPSAGVVSVSANVEKSIGSLRNASARAASLEEEEEQDITGVPPSVQPPTVGEMENDIITNSSNSQEVARRQGGGGLLAALGSSAYRLAPAGVLLALAARTMKGRKGRSKSKSKSKTRSKKTQRRRR